MPTVYNDPIMLDSTGQDIVTKLDDIATLMGDGVIDDTSTVATDKTWSINKISEVDNKLQNGVIANTKLIKDTVGWVNENLIDVGDSITEWFATLNNGLDVHTGAISDRVTATITKSTGSITVTNYNTSGYWWMSKKVKLEKNTDYIFGTSSASITIKLVGSNNGSTGTLIDTFVEPKKINSGNYEEWWISMYPNSFSCSNLMARDAKILDDTFRPYFGSTAVDWASYSKIDVHNILPYLPSGNKVVGDTTFTVTDNGTIIVNRSTGTNSNDLYFLGNSNSGNESGYKNWDIPNACRMTISCRGLQTGMVFFIVKWGTPSTSVIANITDASMKTSFDYDPNGKYRICLRTENGATFDNVTVEPLIKLESDSVDDISKSAMTNYQLSKRTDIVNIQPTVPNAVASIITLDPISGIIQQGNIVNFRIRFTLSVDKTGEFEIVNIGRPSALTYPMFVISDRNAPYASVRGSYLSPVYEPANGIYYPIKTDGGTLTAGTYDVCGTFICKD